MRAVDPKTPWVYVLEAERGLPSEERTRFHLRPLTAREQAQVEDTAITFSSDGQEISPHPGTHVLTILRLGLTGWENLRDAAGDEVPYSRNGGAADPLDYLPPAVRRELSNAITEQSRLSEADRGN